MGHREAPRAPCDLCLRSQERIHCLEGTHEFFEAIGFQKVLLPIPDQGKSPELGWEGPARGLSDSAVKFPRVPEGPEEFYVLSEAALAQPQSLERHKEQLLSAEPVRATLARQRRVFRPSPLASQFDLPTDFFNLTAEEIKREQRLRSEAVERLSVLRTKAMREREEQREMRKYTYTLLRVRLPDGCLLQGVFGAPAFVPGEVCVHVPTSCLVQGACCAPARPLGCTRPWGGG